MSEWKNSPVIAVIIAGATVLSTTLFVVFNYALPVYQKEDKNTIFELRQELAHTQENIRNQKADFLLAKKTHLAEMQLSNDEVKKYKGSSEEYLKKLNELSFSSLFMKGDVLPIGYSTVRPGMTKEELLKVYGAPKLIPEGKNGDILSVRIGYGGLERIEYLFQDREHPRVISHIIVNKVSQYDIEKRDSPEYVASQNVSLKEFFIQNIGYIEACRNDYYAWDLDNGQYDLFIIDQDSYGLYLIGTKPLVYDQDCKPKYPNKKNEI